MATSNNYNVVRPALNGVLLATGSTSWTYSSYKTLLDPLPFGGHITGITFCPDVSDTDLALDTTCEVLIEIYKGSSDTLIAQVPVCYKIDTRVNHVQPRYIPFMEPLTIEGGTRVRVRIVDSVNASMLGQNSVKLHLIENKVPTVSLNSPSNAGTTTDTTPTLDFTGTDSDGHDITYQTQISASAFTDPTDYTEIDIYDYTNRDDFEVLSTSGTDYRAASAQSINGTGVALNCVRFFLQKSGAPTGTLTAYLYTTTGTHGTNAIPTGSPLATSDTIDVTTVLTASYLWYNFNFSTPYTLINGTKYAIVIAISGGTSDITTNFIRCGFDSSSPTAGGNYSDSQDLTTWNASSGVDLIFKAINFPVLINDSFNDNSLNTNKWDLLPSLANNFSQYIKEQNNRLEIYHDRVTSKNAMASIGKYNLTGSEAFIRLDEAGDMSLTNHNVVFSLYISETNYVYILVKNGNIQAWKNVSGTPTQISTTTYVPTTHRWLKIRESSGTTYFDYSADGISWSNLGSQSNPIAVTAVRIYISSNTITEEPSYAAFSNLNIAPATIDKISSADAGFANPDVGGDTDPFTSGENIQYTVQSALSLGTYNWRVRGRDNSGTSIWGAWTASRSFTIDSGGGPPATYSKLSLLGVG